MTETRVDYEEVRIRAEKRVKAQVKFLKHLAIYVCINLLVWADWLTKPQSEIPIAVTVLWGFILLVHGINVFMRTGLTDRLRDQAFEQELELERQRLKVGGEIDEDYSIEDKPKRKNRPLHVRLTDDGELADVEEDDTAVYYEDAGQSR